MGLGLLPETEDLDVLFASLDTEGDGVIDADRAQERLPADLAAAIAPHLAGFSGDFLAFSDFEALVDEALKAPSAGPRALLLPRRERWEEAAAKSPTYSFKPTLDRKSEALAATTRWLEDARMELPAAEVPSTSPLESVSGHQGRADAVDRAFRANEEWLAANFKDATDLRAGRNRAEDEGVET